MRASLARPRQVPEQKRRTAVRPDTFTTNSLPHFSHSQMRSSSSEPRVRSPSFLPPLLFFDSLRGALSAGSAAALDALRLGLRAAADLDDAGVTLDFDADLAAGSEDEDLHLAGAPPPDLADGFDSDFADGFDSDFADGAALSAFAALAGASAFPALAGASTLSDLTAFFADWADFADLADSAGFVDAALSDLTDLLDAAALVAGASAFAAFVGFSVGSAFTAVATGAAATFLLDLADGGATAGSSTTLAAGLATDLADLADFFSSTTTTGSGAAALAGVDLALLAFLTGSAGAAFSATFAVGETFDGFLSAALSAALAGDLLDGATTSTSSAAASLATEAALIRSADSFLRRSAMAVAAGVALLTTTGSLFAGVVAEPFFSDLLTGAGAVTATLASAGSSPAAGRSGGIALVLLDPPSRPEVSTRTSRGFEGSGRVTSHDGTRSAERGTVGAKGSTGRKAGVGGVKCRPLLIRKLRSTYCRQKAGPEVTGAID